ncbi:MAG: glycolate oxidase subunit GlcE [Gammaproteobacteria bacterium]|nr:MAG: glycolate oxidase subunit GlcE [Gammaproteobacteria bacterium]
MRDFVLGVRCINGRGELLRFGGQVMKNVAGFDLSRLLTGSLGTLAVLVEVSFKVLPRPQTEWAGRMEATAEEAIALATRWGRRPLPLSAIAWEEGVLRFRLSGNASAVASARREIGGEEEELAWFQALREQRLPFFTGPGTLWRLSLPATAPMPALEGRWLIEWGGALRWLLSDEEPKRVFAQAALAGGHATLFRGGDRKGLVFSPPNSGLLALQRRIKQAFDPAGILNPGKLHEGL